jgi:hypothetical protein
MAADFKSAVYTDSTTAPLIFLVIRIDAALNLMKKPPSHTSYTPENYNDFENI